MNAQIIEDILNQAKVDKNGRIMNKGRLNDMLHSEHLKAVKNCSIPDVSKSLNMEHNATSVEYAEAIIDMHKNPENSNRDFKIVVLENTIDKLKQDLANI